MLKTIPAVHQLVSSAIAEDLYYGDVTSSSLPQPDKRISAQIVLEEQGIVVGLELAEIILEHLNAAASVKCNTQDGCRENAGKSLLELAGHAYAILAAERMILNFIGRLSGIASACSQLVALIDGSKCRLLDTRKTTPGWRYLEKYATRLGGVINHRFSLSDGVLIKDNHLRLFESIEDALRHVRKKAGPLTKIAIEVEDERQVAEALKYQADHILLDNMSPEMVREMVRIIDGKAQTEASGGIISNNIAEYAATGVDFLSLGSLTTEVKSLGMKMEIVP